MSGIVNNETVYNDYLEEGEHILWSQVPEDRRLHLRGGILGVVFGSVLLIAGAAVFIVILMMFGVLQAVLGSALFVFFGILCIMSSLGRAESYFLTNKRVLIFCSITYKEIRYYNITYTASKKNKYNGLGEITLFGQAALRREHNSGVRDGTSYIVSTYTLYDVKDCERVIEIIKAQKNMPEALEKTREAERYQER